jgi:hypothetical protein
MWKMTSGVASDRDHTYIDLAAAPSSWFDPLSRKNRDVIQ